MTRKDALAGGAYHRVLSRNSALPILFYQMASDIATLIGHVNDLQEAVEGLTLLERHHEFSLRGF